MRSPAFSVFLWSLLLTFIIEGLAVLVIYRRKEYVYYSVLCNLLTNPALNLLLAVSVRVLGGSAYYPALVVLEPAVVLVEAAVYDYICGFGMRKSVTLSVILNVLSFTAGAVINVAVHPIVRTY